MSYTGIRCRVRYRIRCYIWLQGALSGSMFHYKTGLGLAYSVAKDELVLYHYVENKNLLNDFFSMSCTTYHLCRICTSTERMQTQIIVNSCGVHILLCLALQQFQKQTSFPSSWWPTWKNSSPSVLITGQMMAACRGRWSLATSRPSVAKKDFSLQGSWLHGLSTTSLHWSSRLWQTLVRG